MAQREAIHVAARFAGATRGEEHFNGAAVFAAEVIEIRNVVVGLVAKTRQVMTHAKVTGFLVALQRTREVVQVDQAHGHVVQRDSHVFPISKGGERFIGALVLSESLLKAILPMENVSDVVIQAGQAPLFSELREDLPRAFGGCEGPVILSEED